jgi:hypothetical protein
VQSGIFMVENQNIAKKAGTALLLEFQRGAFRVGANCASVSASAQQHTRRIPEGGGQKSGSVWCHFILSFSWVSRAVSTPWFIAL